MSFAARAGPALAARSGSRHLEIDHRGLDDEITARLAASPASDRLASLALARVGPAAVAALADRSYLASIVELRLAAYGDAGPKRLRDRPFVTG
jgi:hypothetical protein